MKFFNKKFKHKHTWKRVSASHYDSITGPRTVISYVCQICKQADTANMKGIFTLEDFN